MVHYHPAKTESELAPTVSVELFGMPRVIAGTSLITASGDDLQAILRSIVHKAPDLGTHILNADQTWLNAGYTFVVDGSFTSDRLLPVGSSSVVLLVSRASGG